MKSDESKIWENLEKELRSMNDAEKKVKFAINVIEEVLEQRNSTLKQDKNIKGLHSMYVELSNVSNLEAKIKVLAEAKQVGWNSGWNSNLKKIFSDLYNSYKGQNNKNNEKENHETTLEKVNKIRKLLDCKGNDDQLRKFVDQIDYFNEIYEDKKVQKELSDQKEFEKYLKKLKTMKCQEEIEKLKQKVGQESSEKLTIYLQTIKNKFTNLITSKTLNEIEAVEQGIQQQVAVEIDANKFITKCEKCEQNTYHSKDDEEKLENEYNKISECKGWSNDIPACKKATQKFEQTTKAIQELRTSLEYIKIAEEVVKVVYKKIEDPDVKYENPINDGNWTLNKGLEDGMSACEKTKRNSSEFNEAKKINVALDNLRRLEILCESHCSDSQSRYQSLLKDIEYLKNDEKFKKSEILTKRIKKVQDQIEFIGLENDIVDKMTKLTEQDEGFPDIDKYGEYCENIDKLKGNIDKLTKMEKNTGLKFEMDNKLKQKFEHYKVVVLQTSDVKQKLEKIQGMKGEELESICKKINAIDNLLNEVEKKKLFGNIKTKILGIKNDLVSKSQKDVDSLKQELRNKFNDAIKTENIQNYKQNLSDIQKEIKTHQPLIEKDFLEKEMDQFNQLMIKLEKINTEFTIFKNISSISITNKESKIIYDMADKLIDPQTGKTAWLIFLKNDWQKYVDFYNACLKKDLMALKNEQDTGKIKDEWVKLNQRINKASMLNLQIKWDESDTSNYNLIRGTIVQSLENKISNLINQQDRKKREEQYFEIAKELRAMYDSDLSFRINNDIYNKFILIQNEIILSKLKAKFDDIIKQNTSNNSQCKNILIKNLEKYLANYTNIWIKEELEQTYKRMEEDCKTTLETNQYFEKANKKYWSVTNYEQAKEIYFEMAQKARDVWNKGLKIDDKVFKTIKHGQGVMVFSRLSYEEKQILEEYNNDPIIKNNVYNNMNLNEIFTKSEFEWAIKQMDQNVKGIENMWNDKRNIYITELENGCNQLRSEDDKNTMNSHITDLKNASLSNIQNEYEQGLNKLEKLKNAQLPEYLAKLKDELKEIKDKVREVHKFAKGKKQDEFKNKLVEELQKGIKLCIARDEKIDKDFKSIMLSWSERLSIDEHHESLFWDVRKNRKKVSSVTYNYLMFVASILNCALDYLKYVDDKKTHDLSGSVVSQIKSLFKDLEDKSQGKNIAGADDSDKIKKVWNQLKTGYNIDMNNIDKYLVSENKGGKTLKDQLLLIDALCLCSSVLYDYINSIQKGTKEYKSELDLISNGDRNVHVNILKNYLSQTRTEGWFGREGMSLGWTVALMVKELLDDKERNFIDKNIASAGYGLNSDEEINNKKMWEIDKDGKPILSTSDIKQSSEGTCWFIAALLGLVEKNPEKILDCFPERKNEVDKNGNIKDGVKEITVRLYRVLAELKAKDREGEFEDTSRNRARPICPVLIKIPVIYMRFGNKSKVCWANYLERAMSVYRTDRCAKVVLEDSLDKANEKQVVDVFVYRNTISRDLWKNNSYKGIWNATGGATDGIAYAAVTGETAGSMNLYAGRDIKKREISNDILKELKRKFNSKTNRVAQVNFKEYFSAVRVDLSKTESIIPGHAYAVSKITDDYVILLDPYDIQYKVTIEDFKTNVKDLKFGRTGEKSNKNSN